MADIRVQDEQGNIHVFPDGTSPEDIANAMSVKPPQTATPDVPWYKKTPQQFLLERADKMKQQAQAQQYGAVSSVASGALAKQPGPASSQRAESAQMITSSALSGPMDALKGYAGQAVDAAEGAVTEVGKGALRSLVQPIATLSEEINKDPFYGEILAPKQGVQAFTQMTTPSNFQQKVGAGIEQGLEMMTGEGIAKTVLARLPMLAKFPRVLNIVTSALTSGADAMAHGESPTGPAGWAAGMTGASELSPSLVPALRKSAINDYVQMLSPNKANNSAAESVVPGLLERKQIKSASNLLKKANTEVGELGGQIDQAVSSIPASAKPNFQNVIDHLDQYKQRFVVSTSTRSLIADSGAIKAANDLQDLIRQLGPDVSNQSLNRLRQIWDTQVEQAGGNAGKNLAELEINARREAANAIRIELARQSPDIARINAEFNFWKGVSNVLSDTATQRTGKSGELLKALTPYIATATGIAHSGPTLRGGLESAGAGMMLTGLNHLYQSGVLKAGSAVLKNQLADAIASGNIRQFNFVASKLAAGVDAASQGQ